MLTPSRPLGVSHTSASKPRSDSRPPSRPTRAIHPSLSPTALASTDVETSELSWLGSPVAEVAQSAYASLYDLGEGMWTATRGTILRPRVVILAQTQSTRDVVSRRRKLWRGFRGVQSHSTDHIGRRVGDVTHHRAGDCEISGHGPRRRTTSIGSSVTVCAAHLQATPSKSSLPAYTPSWVSVDIGLPGHRDGRLPSAPRQIRHSTIPSKPFGST